MSTGEIDPCVALETARAKVRAVYREGSKEIHLDWPIDRYAEALGDQEGTLWIDIEDSGAADAGGVEAILQDVFHFHPLAIEDALKDTHVPKVDDWSTYLYIVFSSIDFDPISDELRLHELDIFLGPNYLLTYHNEPLRVVDLHRRNIGRDPEHRLQNGADHLLYHLLDLTVGDYLPAIEHLDESIDFLQDEVFERPSPQTLQAIIRIKRDAAKVHRCIGPMREVLNRLARDPYPVVREEHRVYFRDVYDHLIRLHDVSEGLRDLISGALEIYLSVSANRTNEIMKALTEVTVMFLPLSFLGGFFGMNFFGATLNFDSPLPKALLFWSTISLMVVTPWLMYRWVKRKGWH